MNESKHKSNVTNYIKMDNNTLVNESAIRWVRKMDECMKICTRSDGCSLINTHSLCKVTNADSYHYLQRFFEEN